MNKVKTDEIIKFIDYVNSFYGKKVGLYASDFSNGGFSITQIYIATKKYLNGDNNWGGGDSMDREAVREILSANLQIA